MLGLMDAAQAIADLTEISPQVRNVVAAAADGSVTGSNLPDQAAAQRLAEGARRLHEAAEAMRPGVLQLEAATLAGSVFVVRDGERMIAATTTPEPTVGLVFYDLKTCLRSIEEPKQPAPRRKAPARKNAEDAAT
jgi:predicted regulator of Ras-like GTPase activity (Roadblock/LC7/MglB family)